MLDRERRADTMAGEAAAAPSRRPGRRRTGMTLPELLLVVTILSILTMIGMPQVLKAMRGQTTTAAADEFVQTTSLARATAQRYGRAAQLHIDTSAATFYIDVDTSGAGQRGVIGGTHDVSDDKVALTSTASLLCFDPRGLASTTTPGCQSGSVTVTFASTEPGTATTHTLQVTTLGKVIR